MKKIKMNHVPSKKILLSKIIPVFFIVTIIFNSGASAEKPPVADARVGFSPEDVTQKYIYTTPDTEIYFDGSKSFDLDGKIKEYYWNFGDGFKDIGIRVKHKYSSKGNFIAQLMVIDNEDKGSLVPSIVSVIIGEKLNSKIKLPKDKEGFLENENIKFLGEATGGTPCYQEPFYKYKWKSDIIGVFSNEKEFFILAENFPLGWHKITLEVEDCLGNKANDSINIAIVKPLKAKITETCKETSEGETITFGRVVFDSSWLRFMDFEDVSKGIDSCDNAQYALNIAKWLNQNGKILIYTSGGIYSKPEKLKNFLSQYYSVDVMERNKSTQQKITYPLLSNYGQVWFIDTEKETKLDDSEIDSIIKYHEKKGNLLLSGEADNVKASWAFMLNQISENLDVKMVKTLLVSEHTDFCVSPTFSIHQITENLEKLSTSTNDVLIESKNPKVEIIAKIKEEPYILVMDYETVTTETKSYICDCEIRFSGEVSGGMPPYEVKWISLEDGVIDRYWIKEDGGSYTLLSTPPILPPLSNDTHSIRFEVVDSLGLRDSDTRYEVYVKWCCSLGANCKTYWPGREGPIVDTGNERSYACDIYEVCHPDLWQLAREAVECCKWKCSGRCHDKCNYTYSEGEKKGTTPEGLTLDGLKKCAGLYLIYGFGPAEIYMTDYFYPELCCVNDRYCYPKGPCCKEDLGKCRCIYHVYTKNVEALPCTGGVSTSPIGWSSDTAMNKNSCTFSDLPAHVNVLGDQGIVTSASGLNTGTCVDYSTGVTTMLRIIGYKPDEVYSVLGPEHGFNLVKFPQDERFHLIDTSGNCYNGWNYNEPYVPYSLPRCIPGYPYCSYYNCHNDRGTFPCPRAYGC